MKAVESTAVPNAAAIGSVNMACLVRFHGTSMRV
jgi:hypothetical protein